MKTARLRIGVEPIPKPGAFAQFTFRPYRFWKPAETQATV